MAGEPPSTRRSRVVVADDHPLVRAILKQVLSQQSDLEVVGEAQDGHEALQLCRRLRPEVVLMDLWMPKMDGIEATRLLKRELPGTVVLVLTAMETPDYLLEAIKSGAAGYVLKHSPLQRICDAVRRVLEGDSPLDGEMAMRLLTRLIDEVSNEESLARNLHASPLEQGQPVVACPGPLAATLTPRELEVLCLVSRGQTNREIAQNLSVAATTVKNHVHHIIAKLGVSDRTQAAVRAVELGLIEEAED